MKLFKKKVTSSSLPSWEEIVSMMYDKDLHFADEYKIVDVIYSQDKSHRYVILKSNDGLLTYKYQKLTVYDEEEAAYFPTLPADWVTYESGASPIFDDINVLKRELKADPPYKTYFEN